jgi:Ni/Fe-hydrogenase subunit HybB-like protein
MSVNPHWFSTMWGPLYMVGQALSAMAFVITILILLSQSAPLNRVVTSHHLHDLGKLLFAFLLFWAYVSFAQYFLIWHGNLPEEVVWYVRRLHGRWNVLAWLIVLLHFVVPFMLLLSRGWKRSPARLRGVALLLLAVHWVELEWIVAPAVEAHSGRSHIWFDAGMTLAIGGLWWIVHTLSIPRVAVTEQENGTGGNRGNRG